MYILLYLDVLRTQYVKGCSSQRSQCRELGSKTSQSGTQRQSATNSWMKWFLSAEKSNCCFCTKTERCSQYTKVL